ncbi:hypothetical protein NE236_41400 [Actinoallomurus purpureus]|uniref:phage terminase small subunit n=1 Tax=Actinoallomurus purpureus TaxID=478114 RepID=UPI002092FDFB|nr:hypothetical protein [Actinoallomurus purpureus]MCO6011426.1 hypothetical protein [Actinoallomurus purpureus]
MTSGPPPDPNALRRDRASDKAGWITLPAEGRTGEPPVWPLTEPTRREEDLWDDLWARPQAVMWEKLGQEYEVAMCVRMLARAEAPKSSTELLKGVKQFFDSLGLSTVGMLRNRWRLSDGGTADPKPATTRRAPARKSSRSRLKVVPSDGDTGT